MLQSILLQQDKNRLLPQVKQEGADRDNCNLDLKVEVNISSGCSLSPGEWMQDLCITFTGSSASSYFEGTDKLAALCRMNLNEINDFYL